MVAFYKARAAIKGVDDAGNPVAGSGLVPQTAHWLFGKQVVGAAGKHAPAEACRKDLERFGGEEGDMLP